MTKERPILFTSQMVKAILDGTKTQTRRVIKPQPSRLLVPEFTNRWMLDYQKTDDGMSWYCPYGQPGDRLWVRESVCLRPEGYGYKADNDPDNNPKRWIPSIHMPREASRITLELTDVRVERIQDISEEDALAEGAPFGSDYKERNQWPRHWFRNLWDSINAKRGYSWESNPYVWVISFRSLQ